MNCMYISQRHTCAGASTHARLRIMYIISVFSLIITEEIYESSGSNVLIRSPRETLLGVFWQEDIRRGTPGSGRFLFAPSAGGL